MKGFSWKSKKQELISCIILLILWEIVSIKINNEIYLPRVEKILISMGDIFKEEGSLINIFSSLFRAIISFTAAMFLAVILGVLSLVYPFFRNFLKPINAIGKIIPTMVLVVLAIVWFDKDNAPFIVGFAIVFPILYEGVLSSLKKVDKNLVEMCQIYNVSTKEKIKKIYIPVIKFYITGIMMSTFSLAFKVVIAGEVHGQPKFGMGSAIQIEKVNFNTTGIFAWIIIIAILSILFDKANKLLVKRVYRWKYEDKN
ncbi:ABC transporter permease [Clostridium vincentii]|uniref:Putative aliphatic sulfonates transport permease protein SsuC n=1 Tax=Clostridium vincentii TaxID=52704 RepID=A0A2T0BDF3_9CLOT|nr:ABC transporter permease subunit [Clostridium vincentii]PRR81916.1 putative aliphatic sulfonates transport permease protein SsuC [Clostridium vincentii]